MTEQKIFYEENGALPVSVTSTHLGCVLVTDHSVSLTRNNAIGKLNQGLITFKQQCCDDPELRKALDIAHVTFSTDVQVLQEFAPIDQMTVHTLTAEGNTSMGAALNAAADMIEQRKDVYRQLGTPYHRPWIFLITDGEPNDNYGPAFQRMKELQAQNKLEIWAIGVPGYDRQTLLSLTPRVIELDDTLNFAGLFEWLSNSLSVRSSSRPETAVQYENLPAGASVVPAAWGK